jgi:hypothetical protein
MGTDKRAAGKRVRVQQIFSKKMMTDHFQTRTGLTAYTRARIRVPQVMGMDSRVWIVPVRF